VSNTWQSSAKTARKSRRFLRYKSKIGSFTGAKKLNK
jgi:hypothetical protein